MRSRCCCPPPQLLPHVLHALKGDTRQCTGHGPSVHRSVSMSCVLHAMPPYDGLRAMFRVRSRAPAPHEVEHTDHDDHVAIWQSMGQACALHARCAVGGTQGAPPCVASVKIDLLRLCAPLPQDFVHVDHMPHCVSTQSVGHA